MAPHRIRLVAGELSAEIAPERGGSVAGFRVGDTPLLWPERATRPGEFGAESMACFPLVPFVNRIRDGRFRHAGRPFAIPRNTPRPHPLHGEGWLAAWSADAHDGRSALLSLQPEAHGWPWRYRAFQRFELDPGGLTVTLGLQSLASEPFPFSLGLHPYFPHPADALLQASCHRVWSGDGTGIPTRADVIPREADFGEARAVAAEPLDHCFDGWDGRATIRWPAAGLALTLEAEDCGFLQVYSPPGEPFFCVEPMTARPDAFNPNTSDLSPIDLIEPGGRRQISMRLELARLDEYLRRQAGSGQGRPARGPQVTRMALQFPAPGFAFETPGRVRSLHHRPRSGVSSASC